METARVYTFPDVQKASEARARITRYGLDAFLIPAALGQARLVVVLPHGGR